MNLLHRLRRERGSVMIMVALTAAILFGFIGLTVDLGRLFVTKTELQSAMDACALAAAQELRPGVSPPDALAVTRAVNAGMLAGNRNNVQFQAASAGVASDDILFSDRLSDNSNVFPFGYVSSASANPATARYVMCAHAQGGIATWFIQVLEQFLGGTSSPKSVGAWAAATLSPAQTSCAIPIGMCSAGGGSSFGLNVGQWYSTKYQPNNPPGSNPTGNFNWIDFNPGSSTQGCSGNGAAELACIIKGAGQCNLPPLGPASCPNGNNPPAGCVGQTGADNSLKSAYDSRFGLYSGNTNMTSNSPDYTGYTYDPTTWTSGSNAYGGNSPGGYNFQQARNANLASQSSPPGFTSATSSQLATYGADRRVVVVPIVNCPAYTPGQNVPILGYGCVLLLNPFSQPSDVVRVEYLGLANDPNSPCSTSGLGGGSIGPLVPVLVQ